MSIVDPEFGTFENQLDYVRIVYKIVYVKLMLNRCMIFVAFLFSQFLRMK